MAVQNDVTTGCVTAMQIGDVATGSAMSKRNDVTSGRTSDVADFKISTCACRLLRPGRL